MILHVSGVIAHVAPDPAALLVRNWFVFRKEISLTEVHITALFQRKLAKTGFFHLADHQVFALGLQKSLFTSTFAFSEISLKAPLHVLPAVVRRQDFYCATGKSADVH